MVLKRIALAGLLAGSTLMGTGCRSIGWEAKVYRPATIESAPTSTVMLGNSPAPQLAHLGIATVPSAVLPEAAAPIQGPTVRAAVGLPAGPRFAATSPADCTCEDLLRELRAINAKLDRPKADIRIPMPKAE